MDKKEDITNYVDVDEQHAKDMKKKIPKRKETCVNEKDSINWMVYSLFLRSVLIIIISFNTKRSLMNA